MLQCGTQEHTSKTLTWESVKHIHHTAKGFWSATALTTLQSLLHKSMKKSKIWSSDEQDLTQIMPPLPFSHPTFFHPIIQQSVGFSCLLKSISVAMQAGCPDSVILLLCSLPQPQCELLTEDYKIVEGQLPTMLQFSCWWKLETWGRDIMCQMDSSRIQKWPLRTKRVTCAEVCLFLSFNFTNFRTPKAIWVLWDTEDGSLNHKFGKYNFYHKLVSLLGYHKKYEQALPSCLNFTCHILKTENVL